MKCKHSNAIKALFVIILSGTNALWFAEIRSPNIGLSQLTKHFAIIL
jgi:hypothetical protein